MEAGRRGVDDVDRSRERLTLRRRGDTLYTVVMEPLPTGRETTMAIDLHPAAS